MNVGPLDVTQEIPSLTLDAETETNDPAIVSLNVPTPSVSVETLKNVGDFLDDVPHSVDSVLVGDDFQLPLNLEPVELLSEHVDIGESSRQVRISPIEDEFIDIGDVEHPDFAAAYYSANRIQDVLASGYEQNQTVTPQSPGQEIGTYGSVRRFESGEYLDASAPRTNAATSQEAAISPPNVSKTESVEIAESERPMAAELPALKTRLAKSSMVGSAAIVLFGATYFESRRVKDRMERAEQKAKTCLRHDMND